MKKERLVKRRVVPVVILTVLTLLFTFLMGIRNTMPLDEVVVLFFLDLIFLAVFIYFLEEERLLKQLPTEECNDFKSIAVVYGLGLVAFYISSYLPDYSSFSFCFAAAMAVVANREMALSTGIFLNLLAAYTQNWDIHVLMASVLLLLLGTMLALAGKEKHLHLWVQFISFFGTIVIVTSCYYAQDFIIKGRVFVLAAVIGGVNLLFLEILTRSLEPEVQRTGEEHYLELLKDNYPLVRSIRRFSEMDYSHALRISEISGECAGKLGLKENLCRAAGFYYRIGRMEGEPYTENGVLLAQNACFPEELIQILREYNGELMAISTRESAIVHMVDKVVTKLDLLDKETFSTTWNQDMVIYQTLNENSATGIYDESGLSMNQFLTIRDFLVKGDHLFDSNNRE